MIIYCTQKLAAKLPDFSPTPLEETSPLGGWHGHLFTLDRRQCVMFCHDATRYAFPAVHGVLTRGLPTGYAAPPLKDKIVQPNEPPPVWPHKDGAVRGMAFYPLYPSVPVAAGRNPALYELLALFDAVRGGSARERALAIDMLSKQLG